MHDAVWISAIDSGNMGAIDQDTFTIPTVKTALLVLPSVNMKCAFFIVFKFLHRHVAGPSGCWHRCFLKNQRSLNTLTGCSTDGELFLFAMCVSTLHV